MADKRKDEVQRVHTHQECVASFGLQAYDVSQLGRLNFIFWQFLATQKVFLP